MVNTENSTKSSPQIMHLKPSEVPPVQQRRVLLVGAEATVQSLISTFLITMGWTCTVVRNTEEMCAILQRKIFDVVVINLSRTGADAEKAIRWIQQIHPSLTGRILVLNSQGADRQLLELIERHDLVQLSHERLLPHLWATLEERVASPRFRRLAPRPMPVARVVFDSLQHPLPAGVRSSSSWSRQVAYQHERTFIDLHMDFSHGTGRMRLTGQVLARENKGKIADLSVVLVNGDGALARTTTNQFGEFHVDCEFPDNVALEIRLAERAWILVPLG